METKQSWHSIDWEEVLKKLESSLDGLTEEEVKKRRQHFGPNELPEEKPYSKIKLFLNQFTSPLIYILLFAGLITFFLKEFTDTTIIFGAVILNTTVGFLQENKASEALSKLKKILKVKTTVLRKNNKKEILQEYLVLGDIIFLKPGNKVPADGRVIEAENLKINEAALTGEWLPAEKQTNPVPEGTSLADRDSMVYMGTVVEDGWGKAVISATGVKTEIGQVAQMVREAEEEKTPYQKKLAQFSKIVGIIIGLICLGIFSLGVIDRRDFGEMLTVSVAIAVAAIPEGLPIAMTVVLALGMQRILKRKGLIRKLVSAETLGSTSIICTDKTATLTEGNMQVAGIYTASTKILSNGEKYSEIINIDGHESHILALKIITLCSEAFIENPNEPLEQWVVRGRPTDKALILAGIQAGISKRQLEEKQPKIGNLPFDPISKYSASLHEFSQTEDILYTMGAPEIILEKSKYIEVDGHIKTMSSQKLKELYQEHEFLTGKGLRVLGSAFKKINKERKEETHKINKETKNIIEENLADLTFVGFIALHDPLRPDAKEAIQICQQAGMKPIIVTGDHALTAKAIAEEVGIKVSEKNILEGKELEELPNEEFEKRLKDIEIYARVEPRQKLRIIEAWQKKGEVVAMTGDGINDAPALKKADIGLALGSGTDVAKEVSDLILLTDNFSVVIAAIEEGRVIIDNIRKVITYLLSSSFSEVILVGVSILTHQTLPVLPAQILWVNIIEDGLPHISLAFEPKEKNIMEQKPQGHEAPLLTREMKVLIFIIGIVTDFFLLGLLFWLKNFTSYEIAHIQSVIFAGLTVDSLCFIFSCKSLRQNLWHTNPFSNRLLIYAWLFGIVALIASLYLPFFNTLLKTVPLNRFDWGILLGIGAANLILIEATKYYFITRHQTEI